MAFILNDLYSRQRTIEVLKNDSDKIRCILNKADQIDRQRLMKVYEFKIHLYIFLYKISILVIGMGL